MPDFKNRCEEKEIMDDLDCHGKVVGQTLKELDIINSLLGGNSVSRKGMMPLLGSTTENICIADVGCGGGDIMNWLTGKKGFNHANFVGIDANPNIISIAKENLKDNKRLRFECMNIFSDEFHAQQFDIIHCSLFLHHFTNDELADIIQQLVSQARIGVVINDLHRHFLAYHSIKVLTQLFSKSEMVKNDAPLSVERGFIKKDWATILDKAKVSNYRITWKWAFRWLVTITN